MTSASLQKIKYLNWESLIESLVNDSMTKAMPYALKERKQTILFSTITPPPPLLSPSLLRHSHHRISNLRPPFKTLIPKSNPMNTTKLQSSINPDLGLVEQI
ncbi:hypothetical protein Tco_1114938 [Tanacetum coccineum]